MSCKHKKRWHWRISSLLDCENTQFCRYATKPKPLYSKNRKKEYFLILFQDLQLTRFDLFSYLSVSKSTKEDEEISSPFTNKIIDNFGYSIVESNQVQRKRIQEQEKQRNEKTRCRASKRAHVRGSFEMTTLNRNTRCTPLECRKCKSISIPVGNVQLIFYRFNFRFCSLSLAWLFLLQLPHHHYYYSRWKIDLIIYNSDSIIATVSYLFYELSMRAWMDVIIFFFYKDIILPSHVLNDVPIEWRAIWFGYENAV